MPEIVELLASPVHRFEGRPSDGPAPEPAGELVSSLELRAGLGVVGDRYFGRPAHRRASVTLIAAENLPDGVGLTQTRRNVLLRGFAIDACIGSVLELDSGQGPVLIQVNRAANPCAWMDVVIGPGWFRRLRGKGGVRAEPLTDGILTLGDVRITTSGRAPGEPGQHRRNALR